MIRRRARAIGLLLAVGAMAGGCTAHYDIRGDGWARQGAGIQQVSRDEIECLRSTSDEGDTYDMILGGLLDLGRYVRGEQLRTAAYERCMTQRGYQVVATSQS